MACGAIVLDPEVVSQLFVTRNDPMHSLTPREREVLKLIAGGRTNSAISRQLFVTEGSICRKVGVSHGHSQRSSMKELSAGMEHEQSCNPRAQIGQPVGDYQRQEAPEPDK